MKNHGSYRLRLQDDSFEDNDGCEALRLRMAGYISLQSPHKKGNRLQKVLILQF